MAEMQTALQAQANGLPTEPLDGEVVETPALQLQVDVDNLSVDGFIELLEIQEAMNEEVKAAHIRGMIALLKPCVVNVDVGILPFRHLQMVMETVIRELSDGGTTAGN